MHWYLVDSQPHREDLAVLNLRQLGVEAFCPRLTQSKVIRRRMRTVSGPLFPGYLFAKFDIVTQYRRVNYAPSVRRVVTFGSVPARVEEEIIESIQARIHNGHMMLQPPSFTAGQVLRIEDSPLRGFEAVFQRELTGSQRVILLLRTVAYQTRVIIARNHVAAWGE